jgi:hypothetical protein
MRTDRTISLHGSTFHDTEHGRPEAFLALVRTFPDA